MNSQLIASPHPTPNPHQKNSQIQIFHWWISLSIYEDIKAILYKYHQKTERVLFKSFVEDSTISIPNSDKESRRKSNLSPISILSTDSQFWNKIIGPLHLAIYNKALHLIRTSTVHGVAEKSDMTEWLILLTFITEMQAWLSIQTLMNGASVPNAQVLVFHITRQQKEPGFLK